MSTSRGSLHPLWRMPKTGAALLSLTDCISVRTGRRGIVSRWCGLNVCRAIRPSSSSIGRSCRLAPHYEAKEPLLLVVGLQYLLGIMLSI